tara:strand:- start:133 stop:378 length:246 start_codon:yes stop_codon:yes gene_type:complete
MIDIELIKDVLINQCEIHTQSNISIHTSIGELNLDSLEVFNFVFQLEDELDISIDISLLKDNVTLGIFCNELIKLVNEKNI